MLIALTEYGLAADCERIRQAGFTHRLVNPVDLGELRELLNSLVSPEE